MSELAVHPTAIPGLLLLDLPVHSDPRGWFKENWQRVRMTHLGLPDFEPVQQNISYNADPGVTRGIHAEPWDKYVSVATGRVFGAWVDLRHGAGFGTVVTSEIGPGRAVYVPRGVGNGFQTLDPGTAYSYLVNDHWSARAKDSYVFVNLADPALGIPWPVSPDRAVTSEADRSHPPLSEVPHFPAPSVLVLGGGGQVGQALRSLFPQARFLTRADLDISDGAAVRSLARGGAAAIVNAAAYTKVDEAETTSGRREAWATNVTGVANLVALARSTRAPLVHISSDYVFDGTCEIHTEDESVSPLGVYGQTKAAADAIVLGYHRGYVLRTSWVIGQGRNFVTTMADLAGRGVRPAVVEDQVGRLTFADDVAAGIDHLLAGGAEPGVYNLSNAGPSRSWADIAGRVFELCGRDPEDITRVSTQDYFGDKPHAPRPRHSTLDLARITDTGFTAPDADERLVAYLGR